MNFSSPGLNQSSADPVLKASGKINLARDPGGGRMPFAVDDFSENARPFNLLRTQVAKIIDERGDRLIGITSATPAAGKTYVSVNLAAAMSNLNNRPVILCDLDLRRGSVREIFDEEPQNELSGFLRGDIPSWEDALYQVGESRLYVVPCKPSSRGSSELLSAPRFAQFITDLGALPPEIIVLIDLPPVFASDDALLTAAKLDGYLLVVEYGRNTAEQVSESIRLLDPTDCLGTILNRYKGGLFDAYGYGYGDPYGLKHYGQDE